MNKKQHDKPKNREWKSSNDLPETNNQIEEMEDFYTQTLSVDTSSNSSENYSPEYEKNKTYFINEYSDFSKQKKVRGYVTKKKKSSMDEDSLFFKKVDGKSGKIIGEYPVKKISLIPFLKYRFGFFPIFIFIFFNLLFLYSSPLYALASQALLYIVVKIGKPFKDKKNLVRSIVIMKLITTLGLIVSTIYMFLGNNSAISILYVSQGLFLGSVSYFMGFYVYSLYYRFYNVYKIKRYSDDTELDEDSFFVWRGVHQ